MSRFGYLSTGIKEADLAKRTNHTFEKRQKEIKRAKKKQEKLEAKRAKREGIKDEAAPSEGDDSESKELGDE